MSPKKGLRKTKNAFLVAEVMEAMSGEEIKEKIFKEEYKGEIYIVKNYINVD